jgi:hypothetical protein
VLNPELLKGKKGGHIWPKMRLKDRIDAIIANEHGRAKGAKGKGGAKRGGWPAPQNLVQS